jgi:prepilin peptidase CpaA
MDPGRLAMDGLCLGLLAAGAVTDVRSGKVSNALTYGGIVAGLVLNAFLRPAGAGIGPAALGMAIAGVPLLVVYLAGGLGGGDVKLAAAAGAFLTTVPAAYALLYSCFAGAVLALGLIVWKEGYTGVVVRVGAIFGFSRKEYALLVPLRFPFAVALLVGTAWANTERNLQASALDLLLGRRG